MKYVYHGSKVHNLKEIVPHQSTHGNYVYATNDKTIAIIMSKRCGDDATYSLYENEYGKYDLIERIPGAFNKMFSNDFSLYYLDSFYFKNINTGFNEIVSEKRVPVIKEEQYKKLSIALEQLVKENKLNIYYYPSRPDYIPSDDYDLINKIRNIYINKLNKKYTTREISRWIFLHPNLEKEFRAIAFEQNIDVPSYEEIKMNYLEEEKHNKDRELYIDCALNMFEIFNSKKR